MEMRVASQTDRGRVRDQNEDAILVDLPLVAVADGMGGHEGGEVASHLALETVAGWKDRLEGKSGTEAIAVLKDALGEANRVVWERGRVDETVSGMGTTLTVAWIEGKTVALAHVGDSRAYLLRGDSLQKLTEDQNVAQQWVRQGRISQDEAATSPQRHILLQAIGTDPSGLLPDVASVELHPGDRLLLASDGMYGMIRDDGRIREILRSHTDPAEASAALIEAANQAGGEDNISVVIVDADGDAAAAAAEPPPPVVVERPPSTQPPPERFSRRHMLIAGAAAAVVVIAAAFLWLASSPSYVVSARHGNLVLLNGHLGRDGHPASGKVVHTYTNDKIGDFARTTQRDLQMGIPVESRHQADTTVAELPRLLGPMDTPAPPPTSPSASPHASARITPPPSPTR